MTTRYVHTLLFSCPHCKLQGLLYANKGINIEAVKGSLTLRCRGTSVSGAPRDGPGMDRFATLGDARRNKLTPRYAWKKRLSG